jgi:hypothetical protein
LDFTHAVEQKKKEKSLDATEFKRTRDGFSTACLKCLDQIAQTAARTKKEKGNKRLAAPMTKKMMSSRTLE